MNRNEKNIETSEENIKTKARKRKRNELDNENILAVPESKRKRINGTKKKIN